MKLNRLILFGLLLLTEILNAQTDFRPGYIINISGDTLLGKIDYRDDLLMSRICKFKNANNTVKEYSPDAIIAFRFIDSKYYVSREINDKKVFLEYLIQGQVNIYYMRDGKGDHYYIDKENVKLSEMPYEEGTKYVDNKEVFYKSKKHIGLLNYYMQDAPEFQSRISSVKKPEHKILIKLAEDYHNAVCEGEKCIIYEKDVPFIKILPEILSGIIKYQNLENLDDKLYFQIGVIGHIWMPRVSEKMYFRTGVLFSQLDFNNGKSNFYKIPVQLEYIYPKGIFRPRIAYGLNLYYLQKYQSASFNFGANVKLNETLFLSATSDIEFNPTMFLIPKDLLSYSLKLGMFMKF